MSPTTGRESVLDVAGGGVDAVAEWLTPEVVTRAGGIVVLPFVAVGVAPVESEGTAGVSGVVGVPWDTPGAQAPVAATMIGTTTRPANHRTHVVSRVFFSDMSAFLSD
jgi:hypothetical protein